MDARVAVSVVIVNWNTRQLLLDVVGGKPGPVVLASAEDRLPVLAPIHLRAARLAMLLGVDVPTISLDDLIANKRATGRAKDAIDADELERIRRRLQGH